MPNWKREIIKLSHFVPLRFAQVRVPHVHDQHHAVLRCGVVHLVLERVVEQQHTPRLPLQQVRHDTQRRHRQIRPGFHRQGVIIGADRFILIKKRITLSIYLKICINAAMTAAAVISPATNSILRLWPVVSAIRAIRAVSVSHLFGFPRR